MTTLHYAAGGSLDSNGNFAPSDDGFNLADVQSVAQLNALPSGVEGLVWLDAKDGATQSFIDQVRPFIDNPHLYGFYLVDEPDPTGKYGPLVTADNLKAESDWIHSNVPGAVTFTTLMNMGTTEHPDYTNTFNPQNTHIDQFGITSYPVTSSGSPNFTDINQTVTAAEHAGIPASQLVPVYQTFGGGSWVTEDGGKYVMPTAQQEQQIIDTWAKALPHPAFDYAYAWGSQQGDTALENSPELQTVLAKHNSAAATAQDTTADPPASTGQTQSSGSTGGTTSTDPTDPPTAGTTTTASGSTSGQLTTTTPDGMHDHHRHHHQAAADASTSNTSLSSAQSSGAPTTEPADSTSHRHGGHAWIDTAAAVDSSALQAAHDAFHQMHHWHC